MLRGFAKLILGIIIFVGLPLLAWGTGHISAFFENPLRLAYAAATIGLQIIIVIAMPSAGQNRFSGKETIARQKLAVLILQVISLAIVILAPYSDGHSLGTMADSTALRTVGLVLYVVGFALMNWAEAALGKNFTVQVEVRESHQLITTGIYHYLRHPRYLGIILCMSGISLAFRSWLSLIAVGLLILTLLWRILDEESLMHKQFGLDWEKYSRKSWRIIPFIY